MAFPEPKPGFVVRYDYLWTHEAAAGRDQGKDRPTCLVAASDSQTKPRFVVLLPITHTPPDGDTIGIEIPAKVKRAIGLDDARSWIIDPSTTLMNGRTPVFHRFRESRACSAMASFHPACLRRSKPSSSSWHGRTREARCAADCEEHKESLR